MHPTPEIRALVGGLLARAARKYSIEVFGYVFMSNHFHLIIQGTPTNIPLFVGWLKREISVRVGRNMRDWSGGFWGRRYDAEPILDDDALEQKLQYIAAHGVKEGLVSKCTDWPGLHCIHQIGSDDELEFEISISRKKVTERLRLTRLPHWQSLSEAEYRALGGNLRKDIEVVGSELLVNRKPLELDELLTRPFDFRPEAPPRKPKPKCHTTLKLLEVIFEFQTQLFRHDFFRASLEYRAGNMTVEFPPGAFRPPLPPRD